MFHHCNTLRIKLVLLLQLTEHWSHSKDLNLSKRSSNDHFFIKRAIDPLLNAVCKGDRFNTKYGRIDI